MYRSIREARPESEPNCCRSHHLIALPFTARRGHVRFERSSYASHEWRPFCMVLKGLLTRSTCYYGEVPISLSRNEWSMFTWHSHVSGAHIWPSIAITAIADFPSGYAVDMCSLVAKDVEAAYCNHWGGWRRRDLKLQETLLHVRGTRRHPDTCVAIYVSFASECAKLRVCMEGGTTICSELKMLKMLSFFKYLNKYTIHDLGSKIEDSI